MMTTNDEPSLIYSGDRRYSRSRRRHRRFQKLTKWPSSSSSSSELKFILMVSLLVSSDIILLCCGSPRTSARTFWMSQAFLIRRTDVGVRNNKYRRHIGRQALAPYLPAKSRPTWMLNFQSSDVLNHNDDYLQTWSIQQKKNWLFHASSLPELASRWRTVQQFEIQQGKKTKNLQLHMTNDKKLDRWRTMDMLVVATFRRATQLLSLERRQQQQQQQQEVIARHTVTTSTSEISSIRLELLTDLLARIGGAIARPRLLALSSTFYTDILVSLAVLTRLQKETSAAAKLLPLAQRCVQELEILSPSVVTKTMEPKRWMALLRALTVLKFTKSSSLFSSLCQRLSQGDALARLSLFEMTQGLEAALSSLGHDLKVFAVQDETENGDSELNEMHVPTVVILIRALSRRLRKASVRQEASNNALLYGIRTCNNFFVTIRRRPVDDGGNARIASELRSLLYTLSMDYLQRRDHRTRVIASVTTHLEEEYSPLSAVALLYQSALLVATNSTSDRMVDELSNLVCQRLETSSDDLTSSSLGDIDSILRTLCAWKLKHPELRNPVSELDIGNAFLQLANTRLLELEPVRVNSCFRSAIFTQTGCLNETQMRPYRDTAQILFQNESFLARCGIEEISNFLWFTYHAHILSSDMLLALGKSLRGRSDDAECCSPKLVCRALSSFASSFSLLRDEDVQKQEVRLILDDVFHVFGEHLLSSQLDPLDVSSALMAYAKTSYAQDMGIFDHLVELAVHNIDEYQVRQIAVCLWACGKMSAFCDTSGDLGDEDGASMILSLPYRSAAKVLASELALRADLLSTKDVAQALWACGHMKISESIIVDPLSIRAKEMVFELSATEIANILWALCKLESKSFDVIYRLILRVAKDQRISPSPQEASNILYALGRLNIRDEAVFQKMTDCIVKDIAVTSAQSIADVLWAHRSVHLTPPQLLVDAWANEKLGLVAAKPAFNDSFID